MRKFATGLGSLLVLAVLLAGIPAALVFFAGNPIPSIDELGRALTTPDFGGQFLIGNLLPMIAWVAWATFAVGVLLELPAQLRGIPAVRLPGLGTQQKVAASLIGAVLVMFAGSGVLSSAPAVAATPQAPATSNSQQLTPEPAQDDQVAAPQEAAPAAAPQATVDAPTYTVQDGDSLWRIAEQQLGAGERFAEIAALNYGTTQADGHALNESHWLNAGWVLTLPADAAAAQPAAAEEQHIVERGDTMWDIADEAYGDGARFGEILEASRSIDQPSGRTIDDPNLILPGEVLNVPGAEQAAPATPAPAPAAVPEPASAPEPVAQTEPAQEDVDAAETAPTPSEAPAAEADDSLTGLGIAPSTESAPDKQPNEAADDVDASAAGAEQGDLEEIFNVRTVGGIGALMAAGLLSILGIRRLKQRRNRKIGQRISMPDEQTSTIEIELRAVENPTSVEDVDHALRYLAVWAQDNAVTLPPLYAIRLAAADIALFLDAPAELPQPFVADSDDNMAWRIDPTQLPELERIPSAPYPALVTIGQDHTDAHILVDLEHVGALNLVGDKALADGALTALAVELATSRWSEDLQITLVGLAEGLPRALNTGRVRHVDDLDTLVRNLRGQAAATERALESLGVSSIEEARSLDPDAEAWIPEIVVLAELPPQDIRDELADLVTRLPRVGIAALTSGHLAGEWVLEISDKQHAALELPGNLGRLPIVPQIIDNDEYLRILQLLEVSTQDSLPGPHASPAITFDEVDLDDLVRTADRHPEPAVAQEHGSLAGEEDDSWKTDLANLLPRATTPVAEPVAEQTPDAADTPPASEPAAEPVAPQVSIDGAPWVRVLGNVEVIDARGEEPRTASASTIVRTTEYVAFLALNRSASAVEVHHALWPDQDPSGQRAAYNRNGQTSRARKWLGNDDEGTPYLPPVTSQGYRLHETVRTDWDLWRELIADDVTAASTENLVAALKLVDGQPFSGTKERRYIWAERIRQEMIAAIGDAAHELAERALRSGDTGKARLAAAVGRQVDPINEIFWRDALKAEHQAGDRAGFDRVVTQLEDHLESFEDGYEAEPETQELIHRARPERLNA